MRVYLLMQEVGNAHEPVSVHATEEGAMVAMAKELRLQPYDLFTVEECEVQQ